jgi:hypothetical protein
VARWDRATAERGIFEMWDALRICDRGPGYDEAVVAARKAEAVVREKLAAQDRLDEAAPALLEACKAAVASLSIKHYCTSGEAMNGRFVSEAGDKWTTTQDAVDALKAAIALAEGRKP